LTVRQASSMGRPWRAMTRIKAGRFFWTGILVGSGARSSARIARTASPFG
jgi:hypothetical protein